MARHGTLIREQSFHYANTVTASNTVILEPTDALYVGATGTLEVVMKSGATITFTAIPAGTVLPISVTQIRTQGTANSVVAFYDR